MIDKKKLRRLHTMIHKGNNLKEAAALAGIDPKTARKYLNRHEVEPETRSWRTREDHFEEIWPEINEMLTEHPRLEAKTILEFLIGKYPGKFQESHLRTLQRKVKNWKALHGNHKEVFFSQVHKPGNLCSSDFTRMGELNITIQGHPFPHMFYHFVLTYSNWESVTLCYSENLESFSEGLQNALWDLGGVPLNHLTDRLTAAMKNFANQVKFGARYQALLDHYKLSGMKTQPYSGNENGDAEQAHNRFKKALDQALMIRGNRDFLSISEYLNYVANIIRGRNSGRCERLKEELLKLQKLPRKRIEDATIYECRVGRGSTITIKHNIYSVDSRLIGEKVDVKVTSTTVEIWYAGKKIDEHRRLIGEKKERIKYPHIIDWLQRKPGAFENYIHKECLFPTSTFRAAYDMLKENNPQRYVKEYLGILKAATTDGEERVSHILKRLIVGGNLSLDEVLQILAAPSKITPITEVTVNDVNLMIYDSTIDGVCP